MYVEVIKDWCSGIVWCGVVVWLCGVWCGAVWSSLPIHLAAAITRDPGEQFIYALKRERP
jgi:hypothetical protein